MGDLPPITYVLPGVLAGAALCAMLRPVLRGLGLARVNYAGREILSGGGLLFVLAALPGLFLSPTPLPAAALAGFGALGFMDDRWGTAAHKGLRGHLRALAKGRVTTGLLKAIGGAALAGWLAWQLRPAPEAALSALLIVLSANFLNLLDLRPLRALKAFWLLGGSLAVWSPVAALCLGLSIPYARLEARRQVMLGDTGANALGGLLGLSAAALLPLWAQGLAAALLLAFHAWAERYSLSAWIDRRPWARRLDALGWDDVVTPAGPEPR
jgi:UDP-N-acetylmuramyl pentapeptide phosphotransferase/UDP-N-acetylglucosamine-1-phosphate transferase